MSNDVSAANDTPARKLSRLEAIFGHPLTWVVLAAAILVMPLRRSFGDPPKPPSMSLALPAFELTDQRGEAYGSKDLLGKVWVADFVFTSCPTACPKLTKRMRDISHRAKNLGESFHLVTFTVDPENDTPERLAAYAKANQADTLKWTFLTGTLGAIETTVVKGFKLAMGKEESSPGSNIFSIFHGERLVLVDKQGNIRGYYEADDEGQANILRDAETLANMP